MSKRKSSPERRTWARMVGHEWQVHLASGEVLRPVRELTQQEASELTAGRSVYLLSFLKPVCDLTGKAADLKAELDRVDGTRRIESNVASLFRGDEGSEAVVLVHLH